MTKHRNASFRYALSLFVALVLMFGSTTSIFAQATPDASPTAGGAGPNLGDAVVVNDTSGDPQLQIAATTLTDPDKKVDAADRGFHYVSIEVIVKNPGTSDVDFNAYSISLVDEQGFVYTATYASRDEADTTARPDFTSTTIAAGESVSGWLFFQVINDATPAWIIYNDSFSSQQFVVIANLEGTTFEDGEAITTYDANAEEAGSITVEKIITDFQKVDSSVTVDRGQTSVAIDVTIKNTSSTDMQADWTFEVVDDYGFTYFQAFSFRDGTNTEYPDLPSDTIPAGGSATGVVLFQLPSDAAVTYVIFQPTYQQLYVVAQPGEGSTVSGDTLTPSAASSPTGDETDVTDEGTPDANSTGTETGDCVGVSDWVTQVNELTKPLNDLEVTNATSLADLTTDQIRDDAGKFGDIADSIDGLDHPEVANDLSTATVEFLRAYEKVLKDAADKIDNGEDPATVETDLSSDQDFVDGYTAFSDAAGPLATQCPDSGLDTLLSS